MIWSLIKPFIKMTIPILSIYVWVGFFIILYYFIFSLTTATIAIVKGESPPVRVEGAVLAPVAFGNPFLPYRDVTPSVLNESRFHESGQLDYLTAAGTPLYAPEACPCVVVSVGFDGFTKCGGYTDGDGRDGKGNSYINLRTEDGQYNIRYMHGDYTVVPGDIVAPGTRIGSEASIGCSTSPHTDVLVKKNGRTVNVASYNGTAIVQSTGTKSLGDTVKTIQHTGKSGRYGSVLPSYENVSIRMSHYDPALGGINCDHDCSTMASGEKVANWVLGQNGMFAAACPQEIPFGTKIRVNGTTFICKDRGGWINAYDVGDFDPAMKRNADTKYFWIDTLGSFGYSYGQLIAPENWGFVP